MSRAQLRYVMSRGARRGDGLCFGSAQILRDSWKRRHEPQFSVMSTEKYSQWVDKVSEPVAARPLARVAMIGFISIATQATCKVSAKGCFGGHMGAEDAGLGWRSGIADLVHRLGIADERATD
jgi:hypothetical protein